MRREPMGRKAFLGALGKIGGVACMCAAAGGMRSALAGDPPPKAEGAPSAPGDKTPARAVKRMEFVDGWVARFFETLDQTVDEPARRKLMEANGKACYAAYAGPPKREPRADELERFRRWIAEKGAQAGYSLQGDAILFEYVGSAETGQASPECVCLCPTAEAQAPGKISPTYCHCSVGYVREMHQRMLGRAVKVELLDSVLKGGKRCRFRLTVA